MPTRVLLIALDAADADLIKALGRERLPAHLQPPRRDRAPGNGRESLRPLCRRALAVVRHGGLADASRPVLLHPARAGNLPDSGDELRGDPGDDLLGLAVPGGASRRHHRRAEGVRHVRGPRQRPDPRLGQSRGRGRRRFPDEPAVARAERPRAVWPRSRGLLRPHPWAARGVRAVAGAAPRPHRAQDADDPRRRAGGRLGPRRRLLRGHPLRRASALGPSRGCGCARTGRRGERTARCDARRVRRRGSGPGRARPRCRGGHGLHRPRQPRDRSLSGRQQDPGRHSCGASTAAARRRPPSGAPWKGCAASGRGMCPLA